MTNNELAHEALTGEIIGAAIEVHRHLGPGLLESSYLAALAHELSLPGHKVVHEQKIAVRYKDIDLGEGYRTDLLIEDVVVVEVKATEILHPVHEAQVISYLRHSGHPVGLLINFNVPVLKKGVKRFVNGRPSTDGQAAKEANS